MSEEAAVEEAPQPVDEAPTEPAASEPAAPEQAAADAEQPAAAPDVEPAQQAEANPDDSSSAAQGEAPEGAEGAEQPAEASPVDPDAAADQQPPAEGDEQGNAQELGEQAQEEGAAAEGAGEEGAEAGAATEEGAGAEAGAAEEGAESELASVPEDAALEAPPPAAPPPYIPPEVGDDYIPVAQLPPLPLPYEVNEEGKKVPLPGVESVFLTGTTVEMVGLGGLGSDKEGGQLMGYVTKEDLLKDIQFRGAISDFYAYKAKIQEADCDTICVFINEEDLYGDGNNYQLALRKAAADQWVYIKDEAARRQQLAHDEVVRAAIEKAKPRSQKVHKVKPWISQGSEVEIEESSIKSRKEMVTMVVSRVRREFNQPYKNSDKDAHELWNSSQMECRPFKDPNFDLRKANQDSGVQAVPAVRDMAVQAGGAQPRPKTVQYQSMSLPPALLPEAITQLAQSRFLDRAVHQCEVALIQNEIANIFADDFSLLTDEEGLTSNRKESIITETQSFTHLTYSKNKVVSAIQWLPHRRGVVAVACTEALSHAERVARAGRPCNAHILVWDFKDSIHPECVLQAPYEVFAFQFNPVNPEIVAAGCYNGQVVVWDMTLEHERIARSKMAGGRQHEGGSQSAEEHSIPVIKHKYCTTIDYSHHALITDIRWLPGIEISSRGKVSKASDKECSFLATTAGDGKVNFWDIRVDRLMKKGRKAEDALDLVWKPCHSLHIISLIGLDLSGQRLTFRMSELDKGLFCVGSADGELVSADLVKQEGEDNPDYVKTITQAHLGPVVSLERSPFFEDVLLTVGDWSFQIWREGQTTPLFTSGYAREYYTCGCWSPSRPAVLYLADQGGGLEVWDLLDRSHEPSIRVTLTSTPIMSMSYMEVPATLAQQPGGSQALAAAQQAAAQFLALGDSAGVLRIVELPRNLRRAVTNEKKLMSVFLEREADRVADLASRKAVRDAANKVWEESQKKAQEESDAAAKDAASKDQNQPPAPRMSMVNGPAATGGKPGGPAPAQLVDEKAEAEYLKMEQRFKIQLGLVPAES